MTKIFLLQIQFPVEVAISNRLLLETQKYRVLGMMEDLLEDTLHVCQVLDSEKKKSSFLSSSGACSSRTHLSALVYVPRLVSLRSRLLSSGVLKVDTYMTAAVYCVYAGG